MAHYKKERKVWLVASALIIQGRRVNTEKKSLAINAVLNVIKQCCMIIFPMITFPYASRVLGVENYGKINFGTSIISYISLIAALGINNYAIREGARIKDSKLKFKKFANEIYSINLISTLLAYFVLGSMMFLWRRLANYKTLIIIQSLTVLFTTVGADWINVIYEDYSFITVRYIVCQSVAVIAMFLFVHDEADYILYAFISILGTILANSLNIFYIKKKIGIYLRFEFSKTIKKHLIPIITIFGSSVAMLIYVNSDITILGVLKDDVTVGYYSVSVKIYSLIKQLINAFLVVAIPRISKEIVVKNAKDVRNQLDIILNILLIIIGPMVVGIIELREKIIILFAGEEYIQGADSLAVLAIALFFSTLACYYVNVVMLPMCMEKQILFATVISAIINIILNIFLIPQYGEVAAALTTVISELILVVIAILYTRKVRHFFDIKTILSMIAGTGWTLIVCKFLINMNVNYFTVVCLAVTVSTLGVVILNCLIWRQELNRYFKARQ